MAWPGALRAEEADAVSRGFYLDSGFHTEFYDGFLTGWDGTEYRSFFVFNIPVLEEAATGATLRLWMPPGSFVSDQPDETYTVWSVVTPIIDLEAGHSAGVVGQGIFDDLGSGVSFGSAVVSDPGVDGAYLFISLNQAAVDAINAAQGSQLAIGGSFTTLITGSNPEMGFLNTSTGDGVDASGARLTIVPEPGAAVLFGLSATAILVFSRRRHASARK